MLSEFSCSIYAFNLPTYYLLESSYEDKDFDCYFNIFIRVEDYCLYLISYYIYTFNFSSAFLAD